MFSQAASSLKSLSERQVPPPADGTGLQAVPSRRMSSSGEIPHPQSPLLQHSDEGEGVGTSVQGISASARTVTVVPSLKGSGKAERGWRIWLLSSPGKHLQVFSV